MRNFQIQQHVTIGVNESTRLKFLFFAKNEEKNHNYEKLSFEHANVSEKLK